MGFGLYTGAGNIVYDLQVSGRLIDVETRAIVASKTVAHSEEFEVGGGGISTPMDSVGQSQSIMVNKKMPERFSTMRLINWWGRLSII